MSSPLPLSVVLTERPAQHTLTLGQWKSKTEMIAAQRRAGHKVGRDVEYLIRNPHFTLLTEPKQYGFVLTTVGELIGEGDSGWTVESIYLKMLHLGFIIAPYESAFALRLAHKDQAEDERYMVLSMPLEGRHRGIREIWRSSDEMYRKGSNEVGMETFVVYYVAGESSVGNGYASPTVLWGKSMELWLCREV